MPETRHYIPLTNHRVIRWYLVAGEEDRLIDIKRLQTLESVRIIASDLCKTVTSPPIIGFSHYGHVCGRAFVPVGSCA